MQIIFTEHAKLKLQILKRHGFEVTQKMVREIVRSPDRVVRGYKRRKVAQKVINGEHVLRVVYEEYPQELRIVTVYPRRRERYEQD